MTRRTERRLAVAGPTLAVVALVALAGCTISIGGPPTAEERNATVVEVVDGDTIDVQFEDGTEDTVRLLGVDTPEAYSEVKPGEFEDIPDTEAGRSCLESWGERASDYATDRLAGTDVTVATDSESDRRGSYDRLLAYVTVDNESFNHALLERGYARLYDSEFARLDEFSATERDARRNDIGLWTCAN